MMGSCQEKKIICKQNWLGLNFVEYTKSKCLKIHRAGSFLVPVYF